LGLGHSWSPETKRTREVTPRDKNKELTVGGYERPCGRKKKDRREPSVRERGCAFLGGGEKWGDEQSVRRQDSTEGSRNDKIQSAGTEDFTRNAGQKSRN